MSPLLADIIGLVGSALFIAAFAYAYIATIRAKELPCWVLPVLVVGQPLNTFMIAYFENKPTGPDLAMSAGLLGIYTLLAVGGSYWWWRREDHPA